MPLRSLCLCAAFLGLAQAQGPWVVSSGQTDVTTALNKHLSASANGGNGKRGKSANGIYRGGHGVLIRAMNDGLSSEVVPASLIVNDIITPSTMYVDGNPFCPNNGDSGFGGQTPCSDDPWTMGNVGVVIGDNLPQFFADGDHIQDDGWDHGVFYGTDSNSVDHRCLWVGSSSGYDCPGGWQTFNGTFWKDASKKGSGIYPPGNPYSGGGGGGSGCHAGALGTINQMDAYNKDGLNIVKNYACQCNDALNGNDWQDWVNQWIEHATPKKDYDWMKWLGKNGKKTAPAWAVDIAACWVTNPRDMIQIQNAMWLLKDKWLSLLEPRSTMFDGNNPASQRRYWGWNEIPLERLSVNDPSNWDSVFIRLPPAICGNDGKDDTMACLSTAAQSRLEELLDWYVNKNMLKLGLTNIGTRPGSYIVFMREYYIKQQTWQREFFCEDWLSPSFKYGVTYEPMTKYNANEGKCYIHAGHAPAPAPPPPAAQGTPITMETSPSKCIDLASGITTTGNPIQIWDCNGYPQDQNWVFGDDGFLRNGADTSKCISLGDMAPGTPLVIEDCDFLKDEQMLTHDPSSNTFNAKQGTVCLDLSGGDTTNGNNLQVWTCEAGNVNQQWSRNGMMNLMI